MDDAREVVETLRDMFGFEHKVGRLVEIRVAGELRAEDLPAFRLQLAKTMSFAQGRVVLCTDLRAMEMLAPDVFDAMTQMLRTNSPKVERQALLVSTAPVLALQMQRLVEATGSPARRVFRRLDEAIEWLEPALTREEGQRMRVFLGAPGASRT